MLRVTWAGIRDGVLLVAGLLILAHELLRAGDIRMPWLLLGAGMIGVQSGLTANRLMVRPEPAARRPDTEQRT